MLFTGMAFGQSSNCCEEIVLYPDTSAVFANGGQGLMKYSTDEIIPVVYECNQTEANMITSLKSKLTIDCEGKVVKVEIWNENISEACKEKLRKKFLTMQGWSPAIKGGKKVCSVTNFPIACIKWQ